MVASEFPSMSKNLVQCWNLPPGKGNFLQRENTSNYFGYLLRKITISLILQENDIIVLKKMHVDSWELKVWSNSRPNPHLQWKLSLTCGICLCAIIQSKVRHVMSRFHYILIELHGGREPWEVNSFVVKPTEINV